MPGKAAAERKGVEASRLITPCIDYYSGTATNTILHNTPRFLVVAISSQLCTRCRSCFWTYSLARKLKFAGSTKKKNTTRGGLPVRDWHTSRIWLQQESCRGSMAAGQEWIGFEVVSYGGLDGAMVTRLHACEPPLSGLGLRVIPTSSVEYGARTLDRFLSVSPCGIVS